MHECAGPSRDVKKPYFIGFLRVPAIGVPGAEGRTFQAPSSIPQRCATRGISCTSCAPSFWNASLGGLALQILRKRIFAPGVPEEMSRER
jgi:hypothetical protein